jgi:hypothetical protein
MQRRVLARFGLGEPVINIQPQIEHWTEYLQVLALMAVSFEKIADEIFLFQRNEFSLLEEPFDTAHQISSSTMPQKRNPNRCEMIKALARTSAQLRGFSTSTSGCATLSLLHGDFVIRRPRCCPATSWTANSCSGLKVKDDNSPQPDPTTAL